MKLQLIGLLKHSRAVDYYDNITTLLTDLGASYHDVSLHKSSNALLFFKYEANIFIFF